MRRTMTTMGLGLALTLGAAAASAQAPRPDTSRAGAAESRRDRAERGDRQDRREARGPRRGGPNAMLLRGITLSDAQKTRLEAVRREQAPAMREARAHLKATMNEAREARQRGDTTTARARTELARVRMTELRDREIASLRTILTADQQRQFDANVAEWKERGERRKGPRPAGR